MVYLGSGSVVSGCMMGAASAGDVLFGCTFVGAQGVNGVTSATLGSLGAQAGDLAVAVTANDNGGPASMSSGSGGVWSRSGTSVLWIFQKIISAGDLASGISPSSAAPYTLSVYRGAVSAAAVAAQSSGNAADTTAGFVKNIAHCGVIAVPNSKSSGAGTVDGPSTFTSRATAFGSLPSSGTSLGLRLYDRLSPANPYYVDGTGIDWTTNNFGVGSDTRISVIELRGQ